MRRRLVAFTVALASLAAPVGAQSALDPVAACIRDNLVKYAPPDRAVLAQYLSLETACRAKIEGDEEAGIETSPLGAAAGNDDSGGSGGEPAPTQPTTSTATTPDAVAPSDRAAAPSGGPPTVTPSPLGRPAGATGPGARAEVLAALKNSESADAVSPAGIGGGPGWLVALVIGLVALVGLAGVLGVRSRPR